MRVIYHERGRDALYKIWNATEENMIIYFSTEGGSIVFQDAIYPMERGSLCFIKAGKIHYTMPDEPARYDRSKIFISEKRMRALLSAVSGESDFNRLFSENSVVYARLPEDKAAIAEAAYANGVRLYSDMGREEGIVSAFFTLLTLLSEYAVHSIKTPDSFMAKAIEYINTSYPYDITLDSVCRAVNMSKSHFCRRFKSAMGITVSEYILTTRIAAAKTMLLSGDFSVSQVAEGCGFSSVSYFCQIFREREGVTATAYRRKR